MWCANIKSFKRILFIRRTKQLRVFFNHIGTMMWVESDGLSPSQGLNVMRMQTIDHGHLSLGGIFAWLLDLAIRSARGMSIIVLKINNPSFLVPNRRILNSYTNNKHVRTKINKPPNFEFRIPVGLLKTRLGSRIELNSFNYSLFICPKKIARNSKSERGNFFILN